VKVGVCHALYSSQVKDTAIDGKPRPRVEATGVRF
jgi:hypothetical protein